MARINGRLVYTLSKWRIAVAKCIIWPVAWAYGFGFMSDKQLDGIASRLARFVCGDIRKNSRIEWR